MRCSVTSILFLTTTLMACGGGGSGGGGGGGGGGYSSPEALVSGMVKALSSGNGSICNKIVVTPAVMKSAVDCPAEIEKEMLAEIGPESKELISECKEGAAQAKKAGVKAKFLSIESVKEKGGVKKGDSFQGCKAKVDMMELKVKAKLKMKMGGESKEDTETFDMLKLGGRYYMID